MRGRTATAAAVCTLFSALIERLEMFEVDAFTANDSETGGLQASRPKAVRPVHPSAFALGVTHARMEQ